MSLYSFYCTDLICFRLCSNVVVVCGHCWSFLIISNIYIYFNGAFCNSVIGCAVEWFHSDRMRTNSEWLFGIRSKSNGLAIKWQMTPPLHRDVELATRMNSWIHNSHVKKTGCFYSPLLFSIEYTIFNSLQSFDSKLNLIRSVVFIYFEIQRHGMFLVTHFATNNSINVIKLLTSLTISFVM